MITAAARPSNIHLCTDYCLRLQPVWHAALLCYGKAAALQQGRLSPEEDAGWC